MVRTGKGLWDFVYTSDIERPANEQDSESDSEIEELAPDTSEDGKTLYPAMDA